VRSCRLSGYQKFWLATPAYVRSLSTWEYATPSPSRTSLGATTTATIITLQHMHCYLEGSIFLIFEFARDTRRARPRRVGEAKTAARAWLFDLYFWGFCVLAICMHSVYCCASGWLAFRPKAITALGLIWSCFALFNWDGHLYIGGS
jgi:hypothetical protein